MTKNQNSTALTEEEQKSMLKDLLLENRQEAISSGVVWASITVFSTIIFCVTPRSFASFIFLLLIAGEYFITCGWSIIFPHIKASRSVKKNRWTYHYLDIAEYKPDTRQLHEVLYCIDEADGYHMATTEVKNATKIHVFDCGGELLTVVDERSCK